MSTKTIQAAERYARQLTRKEFGPCTVVRAVTQRYSKLRRRDVLGIAEKLDINEYTASRQFQEVRHNGVRIKQVV